MRRGRSAGPVRTETATRDARNLAVLPPDEPATGRPAPLSLFDPQPSKNLAPHGRGAMMPGRFDRFERVHPGRLAFKTSGFATLIGRPAAKARIWSTAAPKRAS